MDLSSLNIDQLRDILTCIDAEADKRNIEILKHTELPPELIIDIISDYAPSAETLYSRGNNYYEGKNGVKQDYDEAIRLWQEAADEGHVGAMYMLGEAYLIGLGVEPDHEEAFKWYMEAANKGDARAMYMLGDAFEYGWYEKDEEEALKWYRKAADKGDARAKKRLKVYERVQERRKREER
jgi:hypothetical protein